MTMMTQAARHRAVRLSPVQLAALPLGALLVWFLARQLSTLDPAEVRAVLSRHAPWQWGLAVLASWASFLALGRTEAEVHRLLRTGVAPPRAAAAGMRAIALGQAAGLGLLTGALVRWRLLPELGAAQVARLTAAVGLGFLGSLAVLLLGLTALGTGPLSGEAAEAGARVLLAAGALALLAVLRRRRADARPGLRIFGCVTFDTACAAASLWLFLPAGTDPALTFAAYLAALGAGLLSNAPGGLGAFELTLMALLPEVPMAELMSAVLAHRFCYYAGPALLSLPALARPAPAPRAPLGPVRAGDVIATGPDWALTAQGARILARPDLSSAWLVRPAPFCLVALGAPAGPARPADLEASAALLGRLPLFYRIDGRAAARARASGRAVLRIAREAVIDPRTWTEDGPGRRQLRRKIRQALKAGITIEAAGPRPPLAEMARISRAWTAQHGREKGFSMGRFTPELVRAERTFLARQGGNLVAFVTFGAAPGAWGLDLMRHDRDVPPGTMHALVAAGIRQAAAEGVRQVSLAAVPDLPGPPGRLGLSGLCQFKAAFGPDWRPRYAAAPGPAQLALGLAAVAWAVHRPQDDHEDFGFELRAGSCHPAGQSDAPPCPGATHGRRPLPPARHP